MTEHNPEEKVYIIMVAKGGSQFNGVITLEKLLKKFKDILSLETVDKMYKHEASIQEFGNETWLKSLTLVKLT